MPVTCPNCGGPHPKWECKKPIVETLTAPGSDIVIKRFLVPISTEELMAGLEVQNNDLIKTSAKFNKTAYQREYMRKRRAKEKTK